MTTAAGQGIRYARVTTLDQNEQRKLGGQALDWIFSDKASGICTLRPQLAELLRSGRDADIVALGELRVWQAEPGAKSNAWGPH